MFHVKQSSRKRRPVIAAPSRLEAGGAITWACGCGEHFGHRPGSGSMSRNQGSGVPCRRDDFRSLTIEVHG